MIGNRIEKSKGNIDRKCRFLVYNSLDLRTQVLYTGSAERQTPTCSRGAVGKERRAVPGDWGKRMSLEDRGKPGDEQKDLMGLLTPRELQVLKLVAEGKSNKEIGWALKIGTDTVKLHVTHILQKLEVVGRTQAAVVYVKSGWNKRGGGRDAGGETSGEDEKTKGA